MSATGRPTLGLLADTARYGLATDLYELTMAAAYFQEGMTSTTATFELSVRNLPPSRGYLLTAGLEQALEYLCALRFDTESIADLRALPIFAGVPPAFWDHLRALRFTGDVDAMPEGTVAFAEEPLLQVRAPIIEAQLVETFLLATINHQTLIATKAARIVDAAAGKGIIEFGARRAHGFDAALYGARAATIGGCIGTSNVLAGRVFGLDVYGTAAHSFTMAFADELDAFRAFQRAFPRHATLLIDTYDTLEGARRAASLGPSVAGVRIDSGDLLALSRDVRRILDRAGLTNTIIVASGDLDEHRIAALTAEGAPIDLYGVGTDLITSRDAPALGGVYKLVAVDAAGHHRPVRKLSHAKTTWPDAKQVYRERAADGRFSGDVLALRTEPSHGEPLLEPVLRGGRPCNTPATLGAIRARARLQLEALPADVRRLRDPEPYRVTPSAALRAEMQTLAPRAPAV
jgi:nicotinate phosphoribosyltransferase